MDQPNFWHKKYISYIHKGGIDKTITFLSYTMADMYSIFICQFAQTKNDLENRRP